MSEFPEFAEGIATIDGPSVHMLGVPLPTRMIIVKLADGSLWVNSPVSVPTKVLDRIKASGPVRYLVAPTKMHIWRLEEWHTLGDFIQNHMLEKGRPLLNALWKIGGVAYPHGGVPLDIRLSFTGRTLARRSLKKLLSWEFDKLVIAHGVCIQRDARSFVERAFRWLTR